MRVMARLIKIKLIDLVNQPVLLILLIILPVVLGLIAGAANILNTRNHIDLAVVDHDKTDASRKIIGDLQSQGWHIYEVDAEKADRQLIKQQIDGILTIQTGFAANLARTNLPMLSYREAEGSMMTALARESIAAAVLPLAYRDTLILSLRRAYRQSGTGIPADLDPAFTDRIESLLAQDQRLRIEYMGDMIVTPTLTFVVSDYSMEVFFLSIYAILGSLALSRSALRQRLGTTAKGLFRDYISTIASLQILGMLQIIFYSTSMYLLMRQTLQWYDLYILSVFLFFVLGMGQLLALIEESLRLYLSLLLLLLSAVLGGCFFQISFRLMSRYGQYGPHGWALMSLRRAAAMPVWTVVLLAFIFLTIGFFAQKLRARRSVDLFGTIQF